VDAVAITGARAHGDRVEQSRIIGPTCGDAMSVDNAATDNTITTSEILNAADRGVKVDLGGSATIDRSCIHDNRKGGIQSTLGGTVLASENVVQRNAGGRGQNGLTVVDQCPEAQDGCHDDRRSILATWGNIVRFSGGRGLSVRDNATATFRNDYVTDNAFKGSVVETTEHAPVDGQGMEHIPAATFSGVGLACNFQNAAKQCDDTEQAHARRMRTAASTTMVRSIRRVQPAALARSLPAWGPKPTQSQAMARPSRFTARRMSWDETRSRRTGIRRGPMAPTFCSVTSRLR
jgi:hypothetical protein